MPGYLVILFNFLRSDHTVFPNGCIFTVLPTTLENPKFHVLLGLCVSAVEKCLKSFLQFLVSAYVFLHFPFLCKHSCVFGGTYLPPHHGWESEASLLGSVLSSQHVGSGNRTKVLRLGSRCFYASSHLTGPGSQQFMYSEHQLLACVTNPHSIGDTLSCPEVSISLCAGCQTQHHKALFLCFPLRTS